MFHQSSGCLSLGSKLERLMPKHYGVSLPDPALALHAPRDLRIDGRVRINAPVYIVAGRTAGPVLDLVGGYSMHDSTPPQLS